MSSSTSNYVSLTCAHCRRSLRIRSDYRGHWVICNHCDHAFLAEESGTERDAASRADGVAPEVRNARSEIERLQDQVTMLRQQTERAKVREAELESARHEHKRLLTTLQVLKTELVDRLAEVERLKRSAEDLTTLRAERDQAEAELRAARAEAHELGARLEDQRRLNEQLEARYQAACIEHARENEESFRLWEIERQELISAWRQELRIAQEQATHERDGLHAAAVDREQHLHAQIDAAHRRFDQEAEILRARIDTLESDLDGAHGKSDSPIDQVTKDGDELDALKAELRSARYQVALALQHDEKLAEQLQLVQAVLESVRAEREQFVLELEKAGQDRLSVDRAPDAADASLLRHELARLQENLERLQQQRDEAIEQVAALRLDRDRLHDSTARLETRLQEAEEHDRRAFERLEQQSADVRDALAAANQREAELCTQVESLRSQIICDRADHNPPAAERQEKLTYVGCNEQATFPTAAGVDEPETTAPAEGSQPPTTAADGAMPHPSPSADEAQQLAESTSRPSAGDETPADLPAEGLPRPEPLPEESPEARIHRLRRSLCSVHAAGAGRPFAPLRRILGRRHADQ
jgi:DNA repair exonuclease SbcCD ATPase subunit